LRDTLLREVEEEEGSSLAMAMREVLEEEGSSLAVVLVWPSSLPCSPPSSRSNNKLAVSPGCKGEAARASLPFGEPAFLGSSSPLLQGFSLIQSCSPFFCLTLKTVKISEYEVSRNSDILPYNTEMFFFRVNLMYG
jgi:hypothetical protein